jgi:hypothetical protein
LGGDRDLEFGSFKLTPSGYPKHYSDLFQELERISLPREVSKFITVTSENLHTLRFKSQNMGLCVGDKYELTTYQPTEPSEEEIRRIRIILSVLRWPYSIKLPLSAREKEALLEGFASEITSHSYPVNQDKLVEYIDCGLYPYLSEECREPLVFQPSSRTYKGTRPQGPGGLIPKSTIYATTDFRNLTFCYDGPTGYVTVIPERAGKVRFITSYDGAINSSNFYEKVRAVLDNIPMDCSSDQSKGHKVAQKMSAAYQNNHLQGYMMVSADLSSFTDRLNLAVLEPLLAMLGSRDMIGVFNSPVLCAGTEIQPLRPMMGLKGTFEIASLAHHGIVHMMAENLTSFETILRADVFKRKLRLPNYVMCGDDLLMLTRDNHKIVFERYERLIKAAGLELNRSKSVVSNHTCIFCGKVYHKGYDVSPVIPPLYTLTTSYHDFIRAGGQLVSNAKEVSRGFTRNCMRLVLWIGARYRGKYLPLELPQKLGGFGFPSSRGLISILEEKRNRVFVRFNMDPDPPPEVFSRFYAYEDPKAVPRLPWTKNLLVSGFTKRYRRHRVPSGLKGTDLKQLYTCLEYFYS